jgi:predicted TIM-barrel fold metal-dependent hydrolase
MRALKYHCAPDKQTWSPLEVVKDAIENKGFIGVKLYPPMGFAPIGNGERACPNNADDNFFGDLKGTDDLYADFRKFYGNALDDQIEELLQYCAAEGVPVMAHANNSNMANTACVSKVMTHDYLGSPTQWAEALHKYSSIQGLRINLAHFGRIDEIYTNNAAKPEDVLNRVDGEQIANQLVALIGQDNSVYADLANFEFVGGARDKLRKEIRQITQSGTNAVSKKLLYGSDWYMLSDVHNWSEYLHNFMSVIDDSYRTRFFGLNAVDFLGLKKFDQTRNRIDAFLEKNRVPTPKWAELVDAT